MSEWVSATIVERESVAPQKVRGAKGGRPQTALRRTRNSDGHPDEGDDDGNNDTGKDRVPQSERRRGKIQEPEQPRRQQQQRQPEGRQPQSQRYQRQRRGRERQEQQDSSDESEEVRPEEQAQEQAEEDHQEQAEEDQEQAEKEDQEQSVRGDQEQSEEADQEQSEEDQVQQEESSQEQPGRESLAIVEDEITAHSQKVNHFKRGQRGRLEVQQPNQQHQPEQHPKQQQQRQEQLQPEQEQRLQQQTDEEKGTPNGSIAREEDEGSPTIQSTSSGIEEGRRSPAHHVDNHHRRSVSPSTPNQQIMTTETDQQTIQYPMTPQMSTQHSDSRSFQPSPALHLPKENGIHQLLNAFDLPEMPGRPLRLSAVSIETPSLEQTKYEILGISTISSLPQSKRRIVVAFVGSLFSPKTYWDLRNNVCMIVSKTGLSNTEPEEERGERHSSNNSRPYLANDQRLPSDPPAYLTSFVERWHKTLNFAQGTATPALIKITKTWNEMQCYEHWSRLVSIWNQCRNGYIDENQDGGAQRDNNDSWNERVEYRAEDVEALRTFLYNEIERRKSEPGFKNIAMANKMCLLKTLVAPYLGFPISLLDSPMENGSDQRGGGSNATRKIFNKLWNNTMTRGKGAYFLVKWLGCGALAVAGRTRQADPFIFTSSHRSNVVC